MPEQNDFVYLPELGEPVCPNCGDEGCDFCEDVFPDREDDGQPDEWTEWQDVYGGDEDPHDYDQFEDY